MPACGPADFLMLHFFCDKPVPSFLEVSAAEHVTFKVISDNFHKYITSQPKDSFYFFYTQQKFQNVSSPFKFLNKWRLSTS